MKHLSKKRLSFNILLSVITSCVFAYFVFNTVSNKIVQSEINSKVDSFFSYAESGPVYFARVNSSVFAQNQLNLAINNNQFIKLHPTSILISGGDQQKEVFAEWKSTEAAGNSCEETAIKDFQYPDNLYSFRVLLKYDQCANFNDFNELKTIVGAGLLALVFVIFSLVMYVLHPVFDSINLSLTLIKIGSCDIENLRQIKFFPIQKIAALAINGLRLAKAERSFELATQVSHDIRSPLAALEMGVTTLSDIPEQNRVLIQHAIGRIKNIADTLLKTNKQQLQLHHDHQTEKLIRTPLVPLISQIISEKKLQYKSNPNISFNFHFNESDETFETMIQPNEFQRLLSNLVNNSVESYDIKNGKVEISLSRFGSRHFQLLIADTGRGMDDSLISLVGKKGFTIGKESGNGLGLYHAKETVKNFGGDLRIHSRIGIGTTIEILLPDVANFRHRTRELSL